MNDTTTTHATSHWTVRDCALCGTRLDLTHKADRDHACSRMKQYGEYEPEVPRTITVTYQVVLEVLDEDTSLNHAIDAVSLAVWNIGDDRDDLRTLTASMITAQENTQEDHDNGTCGCCENITYGHNQDGQPKDWNAQA